MLFCRFKSRNLIDVACLPGPKYPADLHSFLVNMFEELKRLSEYGMNVVKDDGETIHCKVHILAQCGDIPMISEIHHLSGHCSYYGCRYCTIRGDNISNTRCFGYSTNESVYDNPPRERTVEDFREGDEVNFLKCIYVYTYSCVFVL